MYNLYLIDRNNTEHHIYPVMLKDTKEVAKLVPRVVNVLMMGETVLEQYRTTEELTLKEQREALKEILQYTTRDKTNIDTFDIYMAKLAFAEFMGLRKGVGTMEKINTGVAIVDRNGNEHMTYSYLIDDLKKAMELLQKIDIVNMANNAIDEDSKEAMLEIVYLALDRREEREDIAKYLDAEFARKAIRLYFDLPVVG
ncbi:hypothetical protein KL86SPO_70599 [uncultured Sporomusa sp.]|uniref:Uncharacterized protein n=1 Tax=uncultured Sporomusa sp. TaxID=307249 RepID=A0A212M1T0_9FIRM|nr:hypothetical protein [uncultured Sporomusa sp.]SCM83741.1 hypothetical protein KL86SPO_70599 [uncultured Sporomusa sp.]